MGVATGCGCKEVYRFPHITYPYSSCIYSFLLALRTGCQVHWAMSKSSTAARTIDRSTSSEWNIF